MKIQKVIETKTILEIWNYTTHLQKRRFQIAGGKNSNPPNLALHHMWYDTTEPEMAFLITAQEVTCLNINNIPSITFRF